MYTDHRKIESGHSLAGSFTVEASLLFPLIILLIVMNIYVSFYLYDSCCIWQGSYLAALRGELEQGSDDNKLHTARESLIRYLQEELWAVADLKHQVKIGDFSVQASVKAVIRVPAAGHIFNDLWKLEAAGTVKRLRPVTFIRMCNKAESVRDWFENRSIP